MENWPLNIICKKIKYMYPIDIIMMCITACIGINMDIWESEPVNRREFGLKHYFMMDLTDRLFQVLSRRKLTEIKGELDRQGLFEDMVIECFHKGKNDLMLYLCQTYSINAQCSSIPINMIKMYI